MFDFNSPDMDDPNAEEQLYLKLIEWAQKHNKSVYDLTKYEVVEALTNKS